VLTGVRAAVDAALAQLVSDASSGRLLVLAHGPGPDVGARRLRPSLAGAGIPDSWVPALCAWPAGPADAAHVPASVALLCLADALAALDAAARRDDVVVREVPLDGFDVDDTARDVAGAAGVVVAGGGVPGGQDDAPRAMAAGVDRVLRQVAAARGWVPEVRHVPATGAHLPAEYEVTTFRE